MQVLSIGLAMPYIIPVTLKYFLSYWEEWRIEIVYAELRSNGLILSDPYVCRPTLPHTPIQEGHTLSTPGKGR